VERGHPSRLKLRLLIAGIVVVITAGTIATALTAPLATRHPFGTLRRLTSDPLYWLLGYWYGDRAIRWLETKGGQGILVTVTEKVFAKAAYPMVFLFPGAIVCALAGTVGMPFWAFLAVNLAGTIATVSVLRLTGDIFGGPVDAILGFFNRHLVATTIVTVSLVVLSLVLNRMQGNSEIPHIDELDSEPESDPSPDD